MGMAFFQKRVPLCSVFPRPWITKTSSASHVPVRRRFLYWPGQLSQESAYVTSILPRVARLAPVWRQPVYLPARGHAGAQEEHHHHDMAGMAMGDRSNAAKPVFVASTAKSFAALMDDAMAVMDDGMKQAPM